jgi:hypothetical protein
MFKEEALMKYNLTSDNLKIHQLNLASLNQDDTLENFFRTISHRQVYEKVLKVPVEVVYIHVTNTVRVTDFCWNKVRKYLWNQKLLSELLVSMTAGKLKAH